MSNVETVTGSTSGQEVCLGKAFNLSTHLVKAQLTNFPKDYFKNLNRFQPMALENWTASSKYANFRKVFQGLNKKLPETC